MNRLVWMSALLLGLTACKTPQVAMDEANHGVMLIAGLENALTEFRRIESNALKTRSALLLEQHNALALIDKQGRLEKRIRVQAGDTATAKTIEALLQSADAVADDDVAYSAAKAQNEALVADLLTPLPVTQESTSTAQSALAAMGKELDNNIRRDELIDFVKAVKASVDDAKGKIAKAEAEASKTTTSMENQ